MTLICLCGHSVFKHILLVGNCLKCPGVARNKHGSHCLHFKSPEIYKEYTRQYNQRYHARHRYL